MDSSQPYCSKCGKQLKHDEIIGQDLFKGAKEYKEAKDKGLTPPPFPGPAVSTCCDAFTIDPPLLDEIEAPPLISGATRVETPDFGAMLRLCYAIEKSPFSIKSYLRLDIIPSLFGPKAYFIDVKAKYFKERIKEIMPTIPSPMIEKEG